LATVLLVILFAVKVTVVVAVAVSSGYEVWGSAVWKWTPPCGEPTVSSCIWKQL